MKLAAVALFAVVATVGCGPSAPDWTVKDEDGQRWRLIECRHKADCLSRATQLCPKYGYVDKNASDNASRRGKTSMMIRCKSEGFN